MRIRYKVALVGGIPITIAAAIAVIAWFLLDEAERARKGAVLAGAAYRELASAMTARDGYVGARPGDRSRATARFTEAGERADRHLDAGGDEKGGGGLEQRAFVAPGVGPLGLGDSFRPFVDVGHAIFSLRDPV